MVDPVNIKDIDEVVARRIDWAKDSTLNRLVDKSEEQVGLLEKIAGVSRRSQIDTRNTQTQVNNLTNATGNAAAAANNYSKALEDNARKLEKLQEERATEARKQYLRESADRDNVSRSVGDLRNSMNNLSRIASSPSSAFDALTDKVAVFGGRLSEKSGALQSASKYVTGFSKVLAAASFTFGALSGISDPYRRMVESGLLFEGSAVRFARSAYDSGLNLEQFSRIAGQYSETVANLGEGAYAQSIKRVRDVAQQFGYFGMSMEEFADAQTRYQDRLRETGILQLATQEQIDAATIPYLQNLTALSVLHGKSRKTLEQEQQQAARQAQVRAIIAKVAREQGAPAAERLQLQFDTAVTNMGQLAATSAFAQQFYGGGPTQAEARLLGPTGLQQALPRFGGSDAEFEAGQQRFRSATANLSPDLMMQYGLSSRAGGTLAGSADALFDTLGRAMPGIVGPRAGEQRDRVAAVREGRVMDRLTERTLTAQIRSAEAINSLKSAALGAAEQLGVLRAVAEAAAAAASVASGTAGFLSGATNTLGGSAAVLGLLGGGAAIGLIVKSMLTGAAVRSIGTMIAPALPAVTSVFGKGAGAVAGGAGSMLSGAGSLLRGLGIAGGVAGAGMGVYQAAAGDTRENRVTGIGGAALSGAATGGMLGAAGGLPGILIGAGLGALVGGGSALAANLLSSQNTPPNATPTAAPMLTEARTGIQPSQMDAYWGSGSPIINLLTTIAENTRQGARASLSVATNTA